MKTATHNVFVPLEEYLRLEAYSNVKHEYLDGRIFAMSGGRPSMLRGRCG